MWLRSCVKAHIYLSGICNISDSNNKCKEAQENNAIECLSEIKH